VDVDARTGCAGLETGAPQTAFVYCSERQAEGEMPRARLKKLQKWDACLKLRPES
jgi:hypothetical protein